MRNNANPGVFIVLFIFLFCAFGYLSLILNFLMTDEPYTIGCFKEHLVVSIGISFIVSIVLFILIHYIKKYRNKVRGEMDENRNNGVCQRNFIVFIVAFVFHAYMWLFLHFVQSHESFDIADLKKYAVLALSQSVIILIICYFERKYTEKKKEVCDKGGRKGDSYH